MKVRYNEVVKMIEDTLDIEDLFKDQNVGRVFGRFCLMHYLRYTVGLKNREIAAMMGFKSDRIVLYSLKKESKYKQDVVFSHLFRIVKNKAALIYRQPVERSTFHKLATKHRG